MSLLSRNSFQRWREIAPGVGAALIASILSAFIAVYALRGYPFSVDEYSYWYQANIFALGRLNIPADAGLKPLKELFTLFINGQAFPKYPPGYSFLLALGVGLGVPALVNPILAGLTVALLFAALRLTVSSFAAACTVLLLAVNSYLLGYAASFYAQTLSLFLAAAAMLAFRLYQREASARWLALAGAACGFGFLVRPLDGFCLLIALAFALWMEKKRLPALGDIAALLVPAGIGGLALFGYNYAISGCFCVATYKIWDSEFRVKAAQTKGFIDNFIVIAREYFHNLLLYPPALFYWHLQRPIGTLWLFASGAGAVFTSNPLRAFCVAHIAALVLLYNFHASTGSPQYGARYWYPMIAPLTMLAAGGLDAIRAHLSKRVVALLLAFMLFLQLNSLLGDTRYNYQSGTNARFIEADIASRCPARSIVILARVRPEDTIKKPPGKKKRKPAITPLLIGPESMQRNPFFSGERVYVLNKKNADQIAPRYPDYSICRYEFPM